MPFPDLRKRSGRRRSSYRWWRKGLPSSLLMFWEFFHIIVYSFMPLVLQSLHYYLILALSQSIRWFSVTTWTVMADLCLSISEAFLFPLVKGMPSIFSTSSLCSLTLVFGKGIFLQMWWSDQVLWGFDACKTDFSSMPKCSTDGRILYNIEILLSWCIYAMTDFFQIWYSE